MTGNQHRGGCYTHGYHPAIVGSYTWRTAENSAAFLLSHLRRDDAVLDVGCGPGTITVGLARRAGRVVGLDMSPEMVEASSDLAASEGVANTGFEVGSAYELPFDRGTFDVVYAHQLLQHLADPVAALREFRRVLRPGGRVAVRDSDYATMVHAPVEPAIERWREIVQQVAAAHGGEAHAGRYLPGWVRAAGFVEAAVTTSTTTYADAEGRAAWAGMWAVRATDSDFATHATAGGFATRSDLEAISAAFRRWADHPHGFWAWLNGEVVAKAPDTQPEFTAQLYTHASSIPVTRPNPITAGGSETAPPRFE